MILQKFYSKWCTWYSAPRGNGAKPGKIPVNPNTGGAAKDNDPTTFGTFEEAQERHQQGGYAGLGVLMSSGTGVVCVDIDDCLTPDGTAPNEIAQWALGNFKGYCEISQSGKGLHFFMQAVKPEGCREKVTRGGCSLEIYGVKSTRYIAVTENPYRDTCGDVIEEQEALNRFIELYGFLRPVPANDSGADSKQADPDTEQHSDTEIIGLLKRNNKRGKITRLMAGNMKDYANDHSAADMALASEIAYYTCDSAQLERIFNTTELANRDKWRDRGDYRSVTVTKALNSAIGSYWEKLAQEPAREKITEAWAEKLINGADGLQVSKSGKPLSTIENALQILSRAHVLDGAMGFNLFSGEPEVLRPLREVFGPAASNKLGEFHEHDVTAVRAWFNREFYFTLTKSDAWDVVIAWARRGEFNPVCARLDECASQWDKVSRLDTWLQSYLGAETAGSAEYVQHIGRKWLIGAVARAMQPGCKMDNVLILEGAQGAGKSRAVRILAEAVYPAGFIENIPVLGNNQETARALRGTFIAELAELSSIQGRVESEHVKAFLTTQEDNVRQPYGRRYERWPRTVTFFGTTNETEYLRDTTGGRRFWSVRVGKIDTDKLRRDAPQLWGEAVHAYKNGESWHLQDERALKQASEQQNARMLSDSWDDAVDDFARKEARKPDSHIELWEIGKLFGCVFSSQESLDDRAQGEQRRFATSLRRCGFANRKTHGGRMRWHLTPEKIREVRES